MKGGKTPPFIEPFFGVSQKRTKKWYPALGCVAPQRLCTLLPPKKCTQSLGKNPEKAQYKKCYLTLGSRGPQSAEPKARLSLGFCCEAAKSCRHSQVLQRSTFTRAEGSGESGFYLRRR